MTHRYAVIFLVPTRMTVWILESEVMACSSAFARCGYRDVRRGPINDFIVRSTDQLGQPFPVLLPHSSSVFFPFTSPLSHPLRDLCYVYHQY